MSLNFVIYKREHDVKHYTFLSLQVALMYIVFIGGVFSVPAAKLIAEKISDMDVQRGVLGETVITLDIADDDRERIQGLSGRVSIPNNHGMLFIFDDNSYHGIWMKDMNFALDVIWLNQYSEVIYIEKNLSPETFPEVFGGDVKSRYVLELPSGFVNRNSIKIGDRFVLM